MHIPLPEPLGVLLKNIEPGTVTNFYGAPGTGKTCACMLAAIECIKNNGSVTYMDTEGGFSSERLSQLTPDAETVLKRVELLEPKTFSEQARMIKDLSGKKRDLVIVDSLVSLYRLEYAESGVKQGKLNSHVLSANRELSKQLSILSNMAREGKMPVMVTSHTFKNWDTGESEVIGGEVLKYWSKVLVLFERTGKMSERKATLMKHRWLPEGQSVKFVLVNEGIKPSSGFKLF